MTNELFDDKPDNSIVHNERATGTYADVVGEKAALHTLTQSQKPARQTYIWRTGSSVPLSLIVRMHHAQYFYNIYPYLNTLIPLTYTQ